MSDDGINDAMSDEEDDVELEALHSSDREAESFDKPDSGQEAAEDGGVTHQSRDVGITRSSVPASQERTTQTSFTLCGNCQTSSIYWKRRTCADPNCGVKFVRRRRLLQHCACTYK